MRVGFAVSKLTRIYFIESSQKQNPSASRGGFEVHRVGLEPTTR